jgi:cytidylate kinase
MVVTIDGPVASGKSTMARLLAQYLGFYYINSGLLFRAIAHLLVSRYGYTAETLEQAFWRSAC